MYVDDLIICSKSSEEIDNLKSCLGTHYKMKDLGKLNKFLGVYVVQSNDTIFINQPSFIKSLLVKLNFNNAKPVQTPVDISTKLEKASENFEMFDITQYQSVVGSLLYISTRTRPDISYAVNQVSKYCSNPTVQHWNVVKRILSYLRGTTNLGILYCKQNDLDLFEFSDSDWTGDINDRSTSGYCFMVSGGAVSWRSNKQNCVTVSTAEAEYVALAAVSQEAIWLM